MAGVSVYMLRNFGIINVFFKYRADCLIFFHCKIVQRFVMFNSVKNKLTYDAMSITECNAVVYEVICCISCICISKFRTCFHFISIESHSCKHTCK